MSRSKLSTLEERATISNTRVRFKCAYFPIDSATYDYLQATGRDNVDLVKSYAAEQLMTMDNVCTDSYYDVIELDISRVSSCVSGPYRPQDKVCVEQLPNVMENLDVSSKIDCTIGERQLVDGDVVIAAITSCTNTSNPSLLIMAGLLAKKASDKGLVAKSWVKTSFAPGSQVALKYLDRLGLMDSLEKVGFNLVGFGCTTCIGNSGPLEESIAKQITDNNLSVCGVLSGNRNFQ